jgi:hypothetical protein
MFRTAIGFLLNSSIMEELSAICQGHCWRQQTSGSPDQTESGSVSRNLTHLGEASDDKGRISNCVSDFARPRNNILGPFGFARMDKPVPQNYATLAKHRLHHVDIEHLPESDNFSCSDDCGTSRFRDSFPIEQWTAAMLILIAVGILSGSGLKGFPRFGVVVANLLLGYSCGRVWFSEDDFDFAFF